MERILKPAGKTFTVLYGDKQIVIKRITPKDVKYLKQLQKYETLDKEKDIEQLEPMFREFYKLFVIKSDIGIDTLLTCPFADIQGLFNIIQEEQVLSIEKKKN